ncbi:lanthionine synthetase C family protein [Kitasatospora sp. NPDC006697]|uniref:lanthionine synthetase C family protein n=1 Tax=Kitasatospora sp. NPDC006697 TaxID=3364020 RepID=UPI0036870852
MTAPAITGLGEAVDRVARALVAEPHPSAPAAALEGGAGVALFLAELARHDSAWLPALHARLAAAAKALNGTTSHGVQHGPAAVLAAVQSAARIGGHYPGLRRTLTAHVAAAQLAGLAAPSTAPGVCWADYDAVTGVTGVGRVLLSAVTEGDAEERTAAEPALRATLAHLVAISRPVRLDGHRVPGWWVPAHRQPTDTDRARFPRGDLNLGTAHGIAGPLALLARSTELGITADGQSAALHRIADWLTARADHDAHGPYWQPRLPLDEELARAAGRPRTPSPPPRTAAWCYGSVGIANALLRAARVTGEPAWSRLALAAAHAVAARPGDLLGPTVCHGEAGYLQGLWRLARQSADPALLGHCLVLAVRLAADWDPGTRYGYPHLTPDPHPEENPGILEGAAGVAAALITALSGTEDPVWDRVLLLS